LRIESKINSMLLSYDARLNAFLEDYGDRGRAVLEAALRRAEELSAYGNNSLGDFDYRGVKENLEKMGERANPSTLLGVMERKYGLIETSYKSSKQHWWRFYDFSAIAKALRGVEEGDEDKKIVLAMYASLEPKKLLGSLKKISSKPRLDHADKVLFRKIAFDDLDKVGEVLNKMMERESEFKEEIGILKEIIRMAEEISIKLIREQ